MVIEEGGEDKTRKIQEMAGKNCSKKKKKKEILLNEKRFKG